MSIKWENIIFTKWKVGVGFCGPCPMSIKWKNNNLYKVLGQSWILTHEYQVRKYNFHKVKSWGGILWTVPHEYQVNKIQFTQSAWTIVDRAPWVSSEKIIIYTKCLDNRGSCPMSIKWENIIFTKWKVGAGFCGPRPMSIKWKNNNLQKVLGQSWILPHQYQLFFWCGIVWSVPHQYHDKNMLGQYWILPHQYHMNVFVLGQSWILPHEYQVRKYNFHKVKSWGGILWTVPHEYQVKK